MMKSVFKMMKSVLRIMDFVFKITNSVFEMTNYGRVSLSARSVFNETILISD